MKETLANKLAVFVVLCTPLAFGILSIFMGQDASWDLKNYHYYNAYAFLNDRWLRDIAPAQIQSFYNPTVDVPFYFLLERLDPRVYGFLIGTLHGINFSLLVCLAAKMVRIISPLCRFAFILALSATGVFAAGFIGQLGTVYHDNTVSLFFLCALLIIVSWYTKIVESSGSKCLVVLCVAGFIAGAGVGLKYTLAPYAVGLCAAFLCTPTRMSRRLLLCFCFGSGVMVGVLVTAGHWMAFLWSEFQSPLFPYLNNIFQSSFAPEVPFTDDRYKPRGWLEAAFYPIVFAINPSSVSPLYFRDLRFAILLIGLVILLDCHVLGTRNPRIKPHPVALVDRVTGSYLIWVVIITYLLWLRAFSLYRYLVGLELIVPLAFLVVFDRLPLARWKRTALTGTSMVLILSTLSPQAWWRQQWANEFFGVKVPEISKPAETVILIAGLSPLSYVIPAFPPDVRFIRVEANWMVYPEPIDYAADPRPYANTGKWEATAGSPGKSRILRNIRSIVEAHEGPKFVLFDRSEQDHIQHVLDTFEERALFDNCQPVVSRLDPDNLQLCPLQPSLLPGDTVAFRRGGIRPQSPASRGQSSDTRMLGLGLRTMRITDALE